MISGDDYLSFVDEALDGMIAIVAELGDERVNRRPDVPGSNSPYALLTHCLGVMEYWGGYIVAGRSIRRDRDAEFRAAGEVADLLRQTAQVYRHEDHLVLLLPVKFPHARHCVRHILNGALRGDQVVAASCAKV